MSRRILQVLVSLLALNAIAGGGIFLFYGLAGFELTGAKLSLSRADVSWGVIDYPFRALAGVWFATTQQDRRQI